MPISRFSLEKLSERFCGKLIKVISVEGSASPERTGVCTSVHEVSDGIRFEFGEQQCTIFIPEVLTENSVEGRTARFVGRDKVELAE